MDNKTVSHILFRLIILFYMVFAYQNGFATYYRVQNTIIEDISEESHVIWKSIATIDIDSIRQSDSLQFFLDNETINVLLKYSNNVVLGDYLHYPSALSKSKVN